MSALTLWDGDEETPLDLSLWDGTVEQPITESAIMPGGAWSISEMLARPAFTVAHRCGRLDWAEYTRRGITECMLRGLDGLEISVARTSDGVWFGLHDQTLLRTSGVAVDPTTVTWAEVLSYPNLAPSGGDPAFGDQPYARLEDLLAPWPGVVFLDLKYQAGTGPNRDELLDLIEDLMPDARSRVVIKFSSGDATPVADWARSRGYKSWGHFRQSDYDTDPVLVASQAAHWDLLGLDAGASQAMWDDLADLSRPIMGADIASAADNTTALGKGAVGTLIGAVRDIQGTPVI